MSASRGVRGAHQGPVTACAKVPTSDLNGWKIRTDFKKGVSLAVHASVAERQDVRAGDILFVAHGTYLVGTVAIVTPDDLPIVLQDHVFRLRLNPEVKLKGVGAVDPWLALAALSTRFVRRQVRVRQFSADIIDKIGERHVELRLPIPRDPKVRATEINGASDLCIRAFYIGGETEDVNLLKLADELAEMNIADFPQYFTETAEGWRAAA